MSLLHHDIIHYKNIKAEANYWNMENLGLLVKELCKLPSETEWVEFKQNNNEPHIIGEYISELIILDRNETL